MEYKQLRKNNDFVDRRFGEEDESLTQEEKALMRFQKQRMKDLSGSKFSLAEEEDNFDELKLTHMGRNLDETLLDMEGGHTDDDDDGDDGTDVLERYNFGGGALEDGGDDGRYKSKKEIMEEVIAKSKMYKALKAKQREDDLGETDALDMAWKEISQSAAGLMRPKGSRAEAQAESKALMSEEDKKFDALARELVFEAKAHAGERTLTKEELASLEQQRLEELEKNRVTREIGGDDLEDDFGGALGERATGGYAARRARLQAKLDREEEDDSEEDSSEGEFDDDMSALEKRRQQQAAGDHPLQEKFRDIAANLLDRHRIAQPSTKGILKKSEESDDESSSDDEGSSDIDTEDDNDIVAKKPDESESASEKEEPYQDQIPAENETGLDMTFTPSIPDTYQEYIGMVNHLDPEDLHEMINRIRAYNANALSDNGRKKLQTLYGCIMQHFVSLAGENPVSLAKIDSLVPHIIELTPYVPFYSGMLSRARLEKEYETMKENLKDATKKADAWPHMRTILFSKLLMDIYPVTDKKHPVLTPLHRYLCASLTLCPIVKPAHVVKGLLISHLLLNAHVKSSRFVPEVLHYAVSLMQAFSAFVSMDFDPEDDHQWMKIFARKQFKQRNYSVKELSIVSCINLEEEDASQALLDSILNASLELLKAIVDSTHLDSFEELFEQAMPFLQELVYQKESKDCFFSKSTLNVSKEILDEIQRKSDEISARRTPMVMHVMTKAPSVKQYNPKFEESFVKGKDYDPDRVRAEERKLKKQIRKEERGAIRELRKDAAFMAGVRDQEKRNLQNKLDNSAKRAMSFLQQQESDFKSGGQQGMWKKKKKK